MSNTYPKSLLTLLLCCCSALLLAQDVRMGQAVRVDRCGGTFVDGGGRDNNHAAPGRRESITICSDGSTAGNTHVQLVFTTVDIQGTLVLLNGNSTVADTLLVIEPDDNGNRITATATAANASGCITVVFESTGIKPGWEADINCLAACQPIVAELSGSDPAVQPTGNNNFIDLCLGQTLTLTGGASFPENNRVYSQSEAGSTFEWDLGDGNTATGQTVTHRFEKPGGYLINLEVTDDRGCTSSNDLSQRVRVAGPPIIEPSIDDELIICPGESVTLGLDQAASNDISFTATEQEISFSAPPPTGEGFNIPDVGSSQLSSRLDIRSFEPGQQLTTPAAIERICVTLEHDFIGDLEMWIQCPNGGRVNLMDYDPGIGGSLEQHFGYPERVPNGPAPPLTYCFSVGADRTVVQVAQSLPSSPSIPTTLPADIDYLPADGNFTGLVGCTLNGEWTLNVIDFQDEDDGTVYSWNIEFRDQPGTITETFVNAITDLSWADSGIHSAYSPQRITYQGEDPGYANQRIVATDELGCTYDTLVPVYIRSPYASGCFDCRGSEADIELDTSLCAGDTLSFELPETFTLSDENIRWRAFTDERVNAADFAATVPYRSTLSVTDHEPLVIGDPVTDLLEVCVDYTSLGNPGGLSLVLLAPGGEEVILIPTGSIPTGRLERCFIPDASPRWSALTGSNLNGDWSLELRDDTGNSTGRLTSWSIELSRRPSVSYSWRPAADALSCLDCPNPTISPSASGTYTLTARSAEGCTQRVNVNITLGNTNVDIPSEVDEGCGGGNEGSITLLPPPDLIAPNYSWSTGDSTPVVTGLAPGTYSVTVSSGGNCAQTLTYELAPPPALTIAIDEVVDATCPGETDGSISTTTTGGTAPYTFNWSSPELGTAGDAGAVNAGTYTLFATDARGCRDTLDINVGGSEQLEIEMNIQPLSCPGDSDGSLTVSKFVGSGPLSFQWSTGSTESSIENLPAGEYGLTVTDRNGCTIEQTYSLVDPAPTSVRLTATAPLCGGTNRLEVAASGDRAPFAYSIDGFNFRDAPFFDEIGSGSYTIDVRDALGCLVSDTISLVSTEPLSVDLGPDLEIIFGDSILLDPRIDSTNRAVDIMWLGSYPGTLSCTDCANPVARPPYEITYTVSVMDTVGCTVEDELRVRVRKIREVAVPTGFTPDANGRNDRLLVHGRPGTRVLEMMIFDQWGGLLYVERDFEVNDPGRGWDGNGQNGRPLNAGVYVYKLTVGYEDGSQEIISGQTTLIR